MFNQKNLPIFAPVVLRLGLAAVMVWFGVSQLVNTAAWVGIIPSWALSLSGLDASMIARSNGVFEIITGTLLAVGIFTRWVAAVLFVHLLVITFNLGMTAVGVRDFGLSFSMLALALFGSDKYSFDYKEEKAI